MYWYGEYYVWKLSLWKNQLKTQTFILEQHTFAPALLPLGEPSAKKKISGKINANGTLFVKREMDQLDINSLGGGKLKYKFVTEEGTFHPCEN